MESKEYLPTEDEIEVRRQAYLKHQWKLKHIPFYRQFNNWRSVRQLRKLPQSQSTKPKGDK
jgi:hypothetical protein